MSRQPEQATQPEQAAPSEHPKPAEPLVRNISDTARWAAVYRARETDRPDALFRDSLARKLAGERGEQIAAAIHFSNAHEWSWITRTVLFDRLIAAQLREGVDMVVNLAAGLDARPYRMNLPASLRWVEVDLPELLDYKESVLADEKPVCALERVRLDLSDVPARRELFARLGREARKTLILTEGLLVYLTSDQVGSLARDLAEPASFSRWILDIVSPRVVQMLRKKMAAKLDEGGAVLKFGPAAGTDFFAPSGWQAKETNSVMHTAGSLGRLPWWLSLIARVSPPPKGPPGERRPWSGVCLMERITEC